MLTGLGWPWTTCSETLGATGVSFKGATLIVTVARFETALPSFTLKLNESRPCSLAAGT